MKHRHCTPRQRVFLKNAAQVVDSRVTDPGFTVEEFSRLMRLSRSQLFRRIKAAAGVSVSVFIRGRRLKLAAQLLEEGELTITQVAARAGFGSVSYFRACFKAAYRMTPGEYARIVNTEEVKLSLP